MISSDSSLQPPLAPLIHGDGTEVGGRQRLLGLPRFIFHRNEGTKSITASPSHCPEPLSPQGMGLNRLHSVLSRHSWVDGEGGLGLILVGSTAGVFAQSDTETMRTGLAL